MSVRKETDRAMKTYIERTGGSMSGRLQSIEGFMATDRCCGINGAARARKGVKHARTTALRRQAKRVIRAELNEV